MGHHFCLLLLLAICYGYWDNNNNRMRAACSVVNKHPGEACYRGAAVLQNGISPDFHSTCNAYHQIITNKNPCLPLPDFPLSSKCKVHLWSAAHHFSSVLEQHTEHTFTCQYQATSATRSLASRPGPTRVHQTSNASERQLTPNRTNKADETSPAKEGLGSLLLKSKKPWEAATASPSRFARTLLFSSFARPSQIPRSLVHAKPRH